MDQSLAKGWHIEQFTHELIKRLPRTNSDIRFQLKGRLALLVSCIIFENCIVANQANFDFSAAWRSNVAVRRRPNSTPGLPADELLGKVEEEASEPRVFVGYVLSLNEPCTIID